MTSGPTPGPDPPDPIPLELLFGNPKRAQPLISPDGTRLSYLAPDGRDVLQVWLCSLEGEDERRLTRDPERGVRIHHWSESGEQVLFLQDTDGDENWHLYSTDLEGHVIRDLTPFQDVRADGLLQNPKFPHRILVGLNLRDPRLFDLYSVDLRTGALELHSPNPGDIVVWKADSEFRVRAALATAEDGGLEVRTRDSEESPWRTVLHWPQTDSSGGIHGFTPDDRGLWVASSSDSDTLRLARLDLKTGEQRPVAEDPRSDLLASQIHPLTQVAEAAAFGYHRQEWTILDPAVRDDFERLCALEDGEFLLLGRDRGDRFWVVQMRPDTAPVRYYLLERHRGVARLLWSSRPELERYTLAPMRPVEFKARDGLPLQAYLTLPLGEEPRNLPLVLNVHGGPWVRDTWGFDPEVQWLANRGYAALQVNFRGSSGFGKRFLHAGDREWGGKMHDDLIDAVDWAVREGYADPGRIAIFGGSYGGYAALVAASFTPDVFRCALSVVGPSSLLTLLRSIPPYWEPMRRLMESRIGHPERDLEFLKERSPLFKAHRIRIPMLIAQGANDPRVKQNESEQIVEAIRRSGKEVEYLLFGDEGHGFARPENRLRFYRHAEAFLGRYLGGRVVSGR